MVLDERVVGKRKRPFRVSKIIERVQMTIGNFLSFSRETLKIREKKLENGKQVENQRVPLDFSRNPQANRRSNKNKRIIDEEVVFSSESQVIIWECHLHFQNSGSNDHFGLLPCSFGAHQTSFSLSNISCFQLLWNFPHFLPFL